MKSKTTCGNQIAKNLGNVMPRLMRPELAAAYVALNPGPFRACQSCLSWFSHILVHRQWTKRILTH